MKVFLKQEDGRVFIQAAYHPRLQEIYDTFKGYTMGEHTSIISFPIEHKNKLVQDILALDVSVHEVETFQPAEEVKHIATYKRTGDKLEVLATYSREVG